MRGMAAIFPKESGDASLGAGPTRQGGYARDHADGFWLQITQIAQILGSTNGQDKGSLLLLPQISSIKKSVKSA
jgi:hypothetical protein